MVAGVRDQYSGDCEQVQVVDSTGDAGCSVTATSFSHHHLAIICHSSPHFFTSQALSG